MSPHLIAYLMLDVTKHVLFCRGDEPERIGGVLDAMDALWHKLDEDELGALDYDTDHYP